MTAAWRGRSATAGMVTLEFALIGFGFIGLLTLMMEMGFLLYAQTALDYAAREAARSMGTGQATPSNQTGFQSVVVCPFLSPLLSCNGVTVVLQPVTNFQTAMTTVPASPFAAGVSGSLMLLQVTYTSTIPLWPLNVTQLVGTAAYWNEF
jgi:Flp pilus assembly protein TadG